VLGNLAISVIAGGGAWLALALLGALLAIPAAAVAQLVIADLRYPPAAIDDADDHGPQVV
jgi:hypothetical protein